MNTALNNRNYSFDLIKGLLIFLVVLGHAISQTYSSLKLNVWHLPIFNIIYTFHMPLFIFISGFFFKNSLAKTSKQLLINKLKRFLLPALIYSTIIIILYIIITKDKTPSLSFIYKQYITYWYLICVFILTIVYYIFFMSNNIIKGIIIAIYIASVVFYDYLPGKILKDCQLIRQTFIFGLGAYVSIYHIDYFQETKQIKNLFIILLCIALAAIIRFFWGINMMEYPSYIRILDGIACSMLVMHLIYAYIDKIKNKKWAQPLIYLGRNSLGIYLIHLLFIRFCHFIDYSISFNAINVIIYTSILLITSILTLEVIKRSMKTYSFIFGV